MIDKNPGGERSGDLSADIRMESGVKGPGSMPREVRLGVEYGETEDPSQDKLERLYDQISGHMRQLDALIGKDGYSVNSQGRITIKRAVSEGAKQTILQIEDLLISLFRIKESLETR